MNSLVLLERVVSHREKPAQRPPATGRGRDPRHPSGGSSGGTLLTLVSHTLG